MKKTILNEARKGIIVILMGALITYIMVLVADYMDKEFIELSGDIISIADVSLVTGVFSRLGVSLWGASAVIFWMTWYFCRLNEPDQRYKAVALGFAIVTTMMYLDDEYMIHEGIVRDRIGLPEELMMVVYFITVVYLMVRYKDILLDSGLITIVAGFLFLGGSAGVDVIHGLLKMTNHVVIEDGLKFIGICLWLSFAITYSNRILSRNRSSV